MQTRYANLIRLHAGLGILLRELLQVWVRTAQVLINEAKVSKLALIAFSGVALTLLLLLNDSHAGKIRRSFIRRVASPDIALGIVSNPFGLP